MAKIGKSRQQWRALVSAFAASGESAAGFAERHSVTESTLRWWCSELRREREPQRVEEVEFVDVAVQDSRPLDPLAVVLAGVGHKVLVPAGFNAAELRRLVDALC